MSNEHIARLTQTDALQILSVMTCDCYPAMTGPINHLKHQKACRFRFTCEAVLKFHKDRITEPDTGAQVNAQADDEAVTIPLDEQIKCVRREIAMRKNVYKKRVDSGAMTENLANLELATMIAVQTSLMKLKGLGFEDAAPSE